MAVLSGHFAALILVGGAALLLAPVLLLLSGHLLALLPGYVLAVLLGGVDGHEPVLSPAVLAVLSVALLPGYTGTLLSATFENKRRGIQNLAENKSRDLKFGGK